jgi:hypothetical protein
VVPVAIWFFIGAQPAHSYNCTQIYIVVITLVILLQLAHDTSSNSVHFDFIVTNMLMHIVAVGLFFLLQLARGTSCNLIFTLEVIVVGKTILYLDLNCLSNHSRHWNNKVPYFLLANYINFGLEKSQFVFFLYFSIFFKIPVVCVAIDNDVFKLAPLKSLQMKHGLSCNHTLFFTYFIIQLQLSYYPSCNWKKHTCNCKWVCMVWLFLYLFHCPVATRLLS